mgnify:FL=1
MNPKALIIGLDGISHTLLSKYIEDGMLPDLKNIIPQGFSLSQMWLPYQMSRPHHGRHL